MEINRILNSQNSLNSHHLYTDTPENLLRHFDSARSSLQNSLSPTSTNPVIQVRRDQHNVSPNLLRIQQKAAQLLLGSNNNNALFHTSSASSNPMSPKSPFSGQQATTSLMMQQASSVFRNYHLKKNQDKKDSLYQPSKTSKLSKPSDLKQSEANLFSLKDHTISAQSPTTVSKSGTLMEIVGDCQSDYYWRFNRQKPGSKYPNQTTSLADSSRVHPLSLPREPAASKAKEDKKRKNRFELQASPRKNPERVGITGVKLQKLKDPKLQAQTQQKLKLAKLKMKMEQQRLELDSQKHSFFSANMRSQEASVFNQFGPSFQEEFDRLFNQGTKVDDDDIIMTIGQRYSKAEAEKKNKAHAKKFAQTTTSKSDWRSDALRLSKYRQSMYGPEGEDHPVQAFKFGESSENTARMLHDSMNIHPPFISSIQSRLKLRKTEQSQQNIVMMARSKPVRVDSQPTRPVQPGVHEQLKQSPLDLTNNEDTTLSNPNLMKSADAVKQTENLPSVNQKLTENLPLGQMELTQQEAFKDLTLPDDEKPPAFSIEETQMNQTQQLKHLPYVHSRLAEIRNQEPTPSFNQSGLKHKMQASQNLKSNFLNEDKALEFAMNTYNTNSISPPKNHGMLSPISTNKPMNTTTNHKLGGLPSQDKSFLMKSIARSQISEEGREFRRAYNLERTEREIRQFMLKFDELIQDNIIQNVLIKLWKLLVKLQYPYSDDPTSEQPTPIGKQPNSHNTSHVTSIKASTTTSIRLEKKRIKEEERQKREKARLNFESQVPTLPLSMKIYSQCLPQVKKVLGALYETDDFIAKKPKYSSESIFFDRFCYDMVSLLGRNVFLLSKTDIEFVFRKAYFTLSYNFGQAGIRLLDSSSIITSPFSAEFLKSINQRIRDDSLEKIFASTHIDATMTNPSKFKKKKSPIHSGTQSLEDGGSRHENSKMSPRHRFGPARRSPKSLNFPPQNMKKFQNQKEAERLKRESKLKEEEEEKEKTTSKSQLTQLKSDDEHPDSGFSPKLNMTLKRDLAQSGILHNSRIEGDQLDTISLKDKKAIQTKQASPLRHDSELKQQQTLEVPREKSHETLPQGTRLSVTRVTANQNQGRESKNASSDNSKLSISQLKKLKEQEKLERELIKKSKLEEIMEMELIAKSYVPDLTQVDVCFPISEEQSAINTTPFDESRIPESIVTREHAPEKQAFYQQLASVQNTKRRDNNPVLNGANLFRVSIKESGLNKKINLFDDKRGSISTLPKKKIRQRAPAVQSPTGGHFSLRQDSAEAPQIDILEDFKSYDEALFKDNQHEEVLNQGLVEQSLEDTEISLLQSNRIDRKTILLNHMQMYDKAASGEADVDGMHDKHENLVRKLGSDHIQQLMNKQEVTRGSQWLEQIDELNMINTNPMSSQTQLTDISNYQKPKYQQPPVQPTKVEENPSALSKALKYDESIKSSVPGRSRGFSHQLTTPLQYKFTEQVNSAQYNMNGEVPQIDPKVAIPASSQNVADRLSKGDKNQLDVFVYIDEQGNFSHRVDQTSQKAALTSTESPKKSTFIVNLKNPHDQPTVMEIQANGTEHRVMSKEQHFSSGPEEEVNDEVNFMAKSPQNQPGTLKQSEKGASSNYLRMMLVDDAGRMTLKFEGEEEGTKAEGQYNSYNQSRLKKTIALAQASQYQSQEVLSESKKPFESDRRLKDESMTKDGQSNSLRFNSSAAKNDLLIEEEAMKKSHDASTRLNDTSSRIRKVQDLASHVLEREERKSKEKLKLVQQTDKQNKEMKKMLALQFGNHSKDKSRAINYDQKKRSDVSSPRVIEHKLDQDINADLASAMPDFQNKPPPRRGDNSRKRVIPSKRYSNALNKTTSENEMSAEVHEVPPFPVMSPPDQNRASKFNNTYTVFDYNLPQLKQEQDKTPLSGLDKPHMFSQHTPLKQHGEVKSARPHQVVSDGTSQVNELLSNMANQTNQTSQQQQSSKMRIQNTNKTNFNLMHRKNKQNKQKMAQNLIFKQMDFGNKANQTPTNLIANFSPIGSFLKKRGGPGPEMPPQKDLDSIKVPQAQNAVAGSAATSVVEANSASKESKNFSTLMANQNLSNRIISNLSGKIKGQSQFEMQLGELQRKSMELVRASGADSEANKANMTIALEAVENLIISKGAVGTDPRLQSNLIRKIASQGEKRLQPYSKHGSFDSQGSKPKYIYTGQTSEEEKHLSSEQRVLNPAFNATSPLPRGFKAGSNLRSKQVESLDAGSSGDRRLNRPGRRVNLVENQYARKLKEAQENQMIQVSKMKIQDIQKMSLSSDQKKTGNELVKKHIVLNTKHQNTSFKFEEDGEVLSQPKEEGFEAQHESSALIQQTSILNLENQHATTDVVNEEFDKSLSDPIKGKGMNTITGFNISREGNREFSEQEVLNMTSSQIGRALESVKDYKPIQGRTQQFINKEGLSSVQNDSARAKQSKKQKLANPPSTNKKSRRSQADLEQDLTLGIQQRQLMTKNPQVLPSQFSKDERNDSRKEYFQSANATVLAPLSEERRATMLMEATHEDLKIQMIKLQVKDKKTGVSNRPSPLRIDHTATSGGGILTTQYYQKKASKTEEQTQELAKPLHIPMMKQGSPEDSPYFVLSAQNSSQQRLKKPAADSLDSYLKKKEDSSSFQ